MQIVALNSTCWYRVKSSDLVVAAAASNGSAPEWIYYGLRYQGDTKLELTTVDMLRNTLIYTGFGIGGVGFVIIQLSLSFRKSFGVLIGNVVSMTGVCLWVGSSIIFFQSKESGYALFLGYGGCGGLILSLVAAYLAWSLSRRRYHEAVVY